MALCPRSVSSESLQARDNRTLHLNTMGWGKPRQSFAPYSMSSSSLVQSQYLGPWKRTNFGLQLSHLNNTLDTGQPGNRPNYLLLTLPSSHHPSCGAMVTRHSLVAAIASVIHQKSSTPTSINSSPWNPPHSPSLFSHHLSEQQLLCSLELHLANRSPSSSQSTQPPSLP